jgi:amino acid transporter
VVAGRDADPVATAVVTSFGSWSSKPFAAVVLAAFLACGMAAQALTARIIYSVARDGVLPASRFLSRVDRRPARSRPRPPSPASVCCSGCTQPPSAA